ncbi:hypothetical protein ECEC4402_6083, partial [Escherichia coli EC4402]|jgi:hypothetical protein
MSG